MVYRLTQDEKDRLLKEERQRRILIRKQQVRAQANEYSRKLRYSFKERSASIAESIRREVESGIQSRMSEASASPPPLAISHRRSPRLSRGATNCEISTTYKANGSVKTPKHAIQKVKRTPPRRSVSNREKALEMARIRGQEALKHSKKCRRSEEHKKNAIAARRAAANKYFNQVSKMGAENVPMMR